MMPRAALLLALALTAGCAKGPAVSGDAARGERIHEACLQCHGTEVYVPPQRKITTLAALQDEVVRWGDYYNPALTGQEVDDLVAYLNRDFYRF